MVDFASCKPADAVVKKYTTKTFSRLRVAVKKEEKKLPLVELKLALLWNRTDFAKDEIFTENVSWKVSCLV